MSPLLQYRDTLLLEIQTAARKRDTSAILDSARKLETLENLIALAEKPSTPPTSSPRRDTADGLRMDKESELSAKARGRHHRDNFLRMLRSRGVGLQRVKGSIFRTPAETHVGIAYAHERNKDRWFLGLPENQFGHAVLLCEEASGELMFFSLPQEFMDQYGGHLTRSHGQVKFNLSRRDGNFFLDVPRQSSVSLEAYRDNFCGLK